MSIGALIGICIAFYLIAALLTFIRIEEETLLKRVNKLYRLYEGILYSLTTLLLFLGVQIWLQL